MTTAKNKPTPPTEAPGDAPEPTGATDTAPDTSGEGKPRETAPEGQDEAAPAAEAHGKKHDDPQPRFCAVCGGPLTRTDTPVDGGYNLLTGEKNPDGVRSVVQCGRLFHTQLELRDGAWLKPL